VAKSKFYVVWAGHQTGIYTDWASCSKQVLGVAGAKYKSFTTREEAEVAFANGPSNSSKTSTSKPNAANQPGNKTIDKKTSSTTAATHSKATHLKKKPGPNTVVTWSAEAISKLTDDTLIYTDGGCEPNPGEAGSGMAIYRNGKIDELWYGLYNPNGTNNTAELNALHQALLVAAQEIKKNRTVSILCDSKYAIQCVTQWAINWKKNGWTKSGGEIKNLEIIKKMFSLHQSIKDQVKVLHVNGHVGVEGNELADRMSIYAMEQRHPQFSLYPHQLDVDTILALRPG